MYFTYFEANLLGEEKAHYEPFSYSAGNAHESRQVKPKR